MDIINFKRSCNFTGRNGYFRQSGLEVLHSSGRPNIMLVPITGKGREARCDMEIPLESLPELIRVLQKIEKEGDRRVVLEGWENNEWSLHNESGQAVESDFSSRKEAEQYAKDNGYTIVESFNF